jgi:predicted phage terminase large subunit-like protein
MPGGRVIVIHQRWHNSDLIGRLVDPECPEYDPEIASKWTHVKLPAVIDSPNLAEALGIPLEVQTDPEITAQFGTDPVSALWPERFGLKFFAELRRQNPKSFESLYRGTPRLDDGEFFKAEWFKAYKAHELPKNLRKYLAGDFAVSTRQTADKTCLLPCGVDEDGVIWILPDVVWRRMDSETTTEAIIELIKRHSPLFFWAEKGHISQSIGPFLRKRMQEDGAVCNIVEKTPAKDKMTRAQAFNALVSLGRVRFPTFAPWWRDAETELLRFPEGGHDDFVDAAAWLGIGLSMLVSAQASKPKSKGPSECSLDWVKYSTKWESKQKRLGASDGF